MDTNYPLRYVSAYQVLHGYFLSENYQRYLPGVKTMDYIGPMNSDGDEWSGCVWV
jgi:hypothetical protein